MHINHLLRERLDERRRDEIAKGDDDTDVEVPWVDRVWKRERGGPLVDDEAAFTCPLAHLDNRSLTAIRKW